MKPAAATHPHTGEISQVVEHLFRHEAGKMVATLTGIFGVAHLTLAEDVVQEALVKALRTWPFHGVPKNPSAWLMQVARNLALDVVRREKNFRSKEPEIIRLTERPVESPDTQTALDGELEDDRLRMMFVCCHPSIPSDAQVALALKTLCGFSPAEIGRAFLATEAAIAKRLTRAKQAILDAGIQFEIPAGAELAARLDGVLHSLYLLFNEGYKASSGDVLVRKDLCDESIRLATLLAEHPAGNRPNTHALLALMLLNAARFPTRVDGDGNLLRLKEQDRTKWDRAMIARGMFHIVQSASGEKLTAYHLQAGIAATHCRATDYASTDWPHILELYDQLVRLDDSPVIALNRAIVVANIHGPDSGLNAIAAIRHRDKLENYYLLHAVLGELELQRNNARPAAVHFRQALSLAEIRAEREFLKRRLADSENAIPSI